MIKQKDYQWEAAIKIAKEDGADYVAILLGRLRDAQKEIEALEAAQQSRALDGATCPTHGEPVSNLIHFACGCSQEPPRQ